MLSLTLSPWLKTLQHTLDELQELVECAEPGCDGIAFPEGEPFRLYGVDFDGQGKVFLHRSWSCPRGHRYVQIED